MTPFAALVVEVVLQGVLRVVGRHDQAASGHRGPWGQIGMYFLPMFRRADFGEGEIAVERLEF